MERYQKKSHFFMHEKGLYLDPSRFFAPSLNILTLL
jgi:hypothetical protein